MKKVRYWMCLLAGIIGCSIFTGCDTASTETSTIIQEQEADAETEQVPEQEEEGQPESEQPSGESQEAVTGESAEQESNQEEIKIESDTNNAQVSESEIHFIDTGNADAILIINSGKAMLVDGGENDDETLVVNYIKKQGITELEYVIATHAHADHVGGLDAVVKNFKVGKVFVANGDADTKTYRDFINAAMDKNLSPSVPLEDVEFPLGNSYFTVMNTDGGSDTNNESLVIEYINGNDKVLLMGDAETEVENEILSKVSQVDLLKVGHHGSRTSTSQAFLNKVNPTYGVITCGADNSYGHPHKETVSKLQGIEVHRTDECGNIVFRSTGNGLETDCQEGSLTPGNKQQSSGSTSSGSSTGSTSGSTSSGSSTGNTSGSTSSGSNAGSTSGATVYWTPNGKSYHTTKSCSTLSRSKVINSGTIAESGKYDPCDRCH